MVLGLEVFCFVLFLSRGKLKIQIGDSNKSHPSHFTMLPLLSLFSYASFAATAFGGTSAEYLILLKYYITKFQVQRGFSASIRSVV